MSIRVHYNKLIRDDIPAVLDGLNKNYKTSTFDNDEFHHALAAKLVEEAKEYQQSRKIDELVDLMEIMDYLLEIHGMTYDELMDLQKKKKENRGGFNNRLKLHFVDE